MQYAWQLYFIAVLSYYDSQFNEEYTDDQMGALDGDVIEGSLDVESEVFKQAVETTWKQLQKSNFSDMEREEKDRITHWVKANLVVSDSQDEEAEVRNLSENFFCS